MKYDPLVSVIIIFLNAGRFIEEAVESVFAQTYTNWELLLVDDGSTDGSTDISRRLATLRSDRVRYLSHAFHRNLGMSASRNLGLNHARGEYIAFLDADDCWLPQKLERNVAVLESWSDAAMVYGPAQFWYSWSKEQDDIERDFITELGVEANTLISPPMLLIRCLQNKPPVPLPSTVMVRRQIMIDVGGFEEQFTGIYQLHEDLAFAAKLFLRAKVYVTDECLIKYRQHPDSLGSSWARKGEYHPGRPHSALAFFLEWLEGHMADKGVRHKEVWEALGKALWPYRHPVLYRLSEEIHKKFRECKLAAAQVLILALRFKRRALHQSIGVMAAHPRRIKTRDPYGLAKIILAWKCENAQTVEIRIGSPDGPLFSRAGPVGNAHTGTWVSNGMVFYLQDVTNGLPLKLSNTLDTVKVEISDTTSHPIACVTTKA